MNKIIVILGLVFLVGCDTLPEKENYPPTFVVPENHYFNYQTFDLLNLKAEPLPKDE